MPPKLFINQPLALLCFACSHRATRNKCVFYDFPRDGMLFNEWADLVGESVGFQPKYEDKARLCSCHFVDGDVKNGPTVFNLRVAQPPRPPMPLYQTNSASNRRDPPAPPPPSQTNSTSKVRIPPPVETNLASNRRNTPAPPPGQTNSASNSRNPSAPSPVEINSASKRRNPPAPPVGQTNSASKVRNPPAQSDTDTASEGRDLPTPPIPPRRKRAAAASKKNSNRRKINYRGEGLRGKILKESSSSESSDDDATVACATFAGPIKMEDTSQDGQLTNNIFNNPQPGRSDGPSFIFRGIAPKVEDLTPNPREIQLEKELEEAKRQNDIIETEFSKQILLLEGKLRGAESELALEKAKSFKTPGNSLAYNSMLTDFSLFHYYTGLSSYYVFELMTEWLQKAKYTSSRRPIEDHLLMGLVKLKLNFDFFDLGVRFQVSRHTAGRIFYSVVEKLHSIIFPMIKMHTERENKASVPDPFKRYADYRCIVDCIEIKCAPFQSCLDRQTQVPNDKYKLSLKALIACTPSGHLVYVGKLLPGTVTDEELFTEGGFLDHFVEGDVIIANRRFNVSHVLPPGVKIITSLSLKDKKSGELEGKTRTRIPTDVIVARLKQFKIFESFFSFKAKPTVDKQNNTHIFQLVACLVNFYNFPQSDNLVEANDEANDEEEMELESIPIDEPDFSCFIFDML